MDAKEFAFKNLILKVETGSHLYGTSTVDSDKDFTGICIPPQDCVLGLYTFDQYIGGTKSSSEQRRNTKDDTDITIHSLKKYISLAKDNNPNILELLFSPRSTISFINVFGERLLANRHLFPSQKSYYTMKGYAFSQKQKLITKRERLEAFREALLKLEELKANHEGELTEKIVVGPSSLPWKVYEKGTTVDWTLLNIKELLAAYGQRIEYVVKYGYDVKFASHLIRLLYEAKEILETGVLEFPLRNRQEILDIKTGKYTLDEVLARSEELEKEVDEIFKTTKLPHTNDMKAISDFLVDMLKDYWYAEYVDRDSIDLPFWPDHQPS